MAWRNCIKSHGREEIGFSNFVEKMTNDISFCPVFLCHFLADDSRFNSFNRGVVLEIRRCRISTSLWGRKSRRFSRRDCEFVLTNRFALKLVRLAQSCDMRDFSTVRHFAIFFFVRKRRFCEFFVLFVSKKKGKNLQLPCHYSPMLSCTSTTILTSICLTKLKMSC